MSSGIGLWGAHRVGKTTLAKLFSEKHGIALLQTRVSDTFARLGLDPAAPMSFEERMRVQREVLSDLERAYSEQSGQFITDRTPIDLIAYTMAEVIPGNVTPEQSVLFKAYYDACMRVLNRHFGVVIGVQPGIKLVEAPGKAALHEGYIGHLNTIMMGLAVSEDVLCDHYFIPRRYLDLKARLSAMEWAVGKSAEKRVAVAVYAQNSGVVYH